MSASYFLGGDVRIAGPEEKRVDSESCRPVDDAFVFRAALGFREIDLVVVFGPSDVDSHALCMGIEYEGAHAICERGNFGLVFFGSVV